MRETRNFCLGGAVFCSCMLFCCIFHCLKPPIERKDTLWGHGYLFLRETKTSLFFLGGGGRLKQTQPFGGYHVGGDSCPPTTFERVPYGKSGHLGVGSNSGLIPDKISFGFPPRKGKVASQTGQTTFSLEQCFKVPIVFGPAQNGGLAKPNPQSLHKNHTQWQRITD